MPWTGNNLPSKFSKLNVCLQANVLQSGVCTYVVFVQFNLHIGSKYRDDNDDIDDNHDDDDDNNDEQEEEQRISENSNC
jgi:surface antigen